MPPSEENLHLHQYYRKSMTQKEANSIVINTAFKLEGLNIAFSLLTSKEKALYFSAKHALETNDFTASQPAPTELSGQKDNTDLGDS